MNEKTAAYNKSIHRLGRISTAIAILLILSVPIVMTALNKEHFDLQATIKAVAQVWMVYIPVALIEVLSFTPALGAGGTYLAFISGNIANMKLPAAISGQNLAGVDPQSDEGEVISVISIAVSSIITMLVIFIGMLLLAPLVTVLENPILKPGFDNLMPALIGAMLIPFASKSPKLVIVPLLVSITLGTLVPGNKWGLYQGYFLLINIVISVTAGLLMYKAGWLTPKQQKKESIQEFK